MNTRIILLAIIAPALLLTCPAEAAKRRARAAAAPAATDPLKAEGTTPAQQLAPYIQHIDELLAVHRRSESAAALDQAQGRLALMKQAFTTSRAGAPAGQRAALDAAITTCNRLTAALDERKQTLDRIHASTATKGSDDLGERRKDTLTDGVDGRRKAKGAKIELKRERIASAEARREAAERDDTMAARSIQRWNERAIDLRKQITEAYARIPAA